MFENFVIPGNAVAAVAAAEDAEVLSALKMAQQAGLKKAYLTGNKECVTALMRDLGMNPEGIEVLDAQDSVQASRLAVKLVREGRANLLMKGLVDSAILLKAVLNKEEGIMEGRRLSHAALMKVPGHKPFVIADGAVNIAPGVEEKIDIIENTLRLTRALGIDQPAVLLISAVEKISPKMQSTLDAQAIMAHYQNDKRLKAAGPMALDIAVSKEAARHKGYDNPLAGEGDILLMPNIESGNVLYKSLIHFAKAQAAALVLGAAAPIVMTSRSDTQDVKFHSILLSALMAAR